MADASLTSADRARSHTARMIASIDAALSDVAPGSVRRLLDVGCGHGGLTAHVRDRLGIGEAHGVDVDSEAVQGATRQGINARQWDLTRTPLPYEDSFFDLVASFGALNYLPTLDGVLRDVHRICADGAYVLVALPNLASWHNRLVLARGYQPRDAEVSSEVLVGVHPHYRGQPPVGHVTGITTRAFCELMAHVGFSLVRLIGAAPTSGRARGVTAAVDRLAARRPTLARRFVYLGRKVDASPAPTAASGWWQQVTDRG